MDGFISTTFTMIARAIGLRLTQYVNPTTGEVRFATLTGYQPVGFDPLATLWDGTGAMVHAAAKDGSARMSGSAWSPATLNRLGKRDDHNRHSNAVGLTYAEALEHPVYGKTAASVDAVKASFTPAEEVAA